jgi:hypothetical protein
VLEEYDRSRPRMIDLQTIKRCIKSEEIVRIDATLKRGADYGIFGWREVYALTVAAMPSPTFPTRLLNEDVSHRLGGGTKEMGPPVPSWVVAADQTKVGLMHERCRLEGLPWRRRRKPRSCQRPELFVDNRKQLGGGVALMRTLGGEVQGQVFLGQG